MRWMRYAMVAAVAFALLAGGWAATHHDSGIEKLGHSQGEYIYEHWARFGDRNGTGMTCRDLQDKSLYDSQGIEISWHHLYQIRLVCEETVKKLAAEQAD